MKQKRMGEILISLMLLCAMAVNLTGCSTRVSADDLMEGITAREVDGVDDLTAGSASVTDFAVRLFKASSGSGANTLISPLSVLCALSMTANGAKGETLSQMEAVLGMTVEELNNYLYSYMKALPQGEKYKLSVANSVWFTGDERFTVNQDFLQLNADYYGADIYKAPFDSSTLKDINNWVKNETDNMIPKILDNISEDAVMYLVNALAFEAEWTKVYEKHQVRDGSFTLEDGTKQNAEFMYCNEGVYLEDEKASGFVKYYQGRKYAFVALLPNEGVSVSDYIAYLDGAKLNEMLASPQYTVVQTAIPKFETEYNTEMSDVLKLMGMTNAFDANLSDFDGLGTWSEGSITINRVLHKTFISVGEKGTRAGAATVVEMTGNAAAYPDEPKMVYLDRPFVYMLIDCETNIPFFIGTMTDLNK